MPLQSTSGAASYDAFGGGVAAVPKYIEDFFSTFLYSGSGGSTSITNNIDLSTKGGLVWIKSRGNTNSHWLWDTARGTFNGISSNSTSSTTSFGGVSAFNSDGFNLGSDSATNGSGVNFASWSFAKAPKFFDVVTYTGNGSAGRTVAHSLGSAPGCIIVKKTSGADSWAVYHRSAAKSGYTAKESYLILNSTQQVEGPYSGYWNNTDPTDTVFTLGNDGWVNANGSTYVAYIFAHNAGGFGLSGADNVISCGSITMPSDYVDINVTLGYEPQFILMKSASYDDSIGWFLCDNMRGMTVARPTNILLANTSGAEQPNSYNLLKPTSTGFTTSPQGGGWFNQKYIYIAIRRGPMKVPTSGTSVFSPIAYAGNDVSNRIISGLINSPDLGLFTSRNAAGQANHITGSRLQGGGRYMLTESTSSESSSTAYGIQTYGQTSVTLGTAITNEQNALGINYILYAWQRAPSFFDVVCYTGTGSANTAFTHNLTVTPELMIVKPRSAATAPNWRVWSPINSTDFNLLQLSTNGAASSSLYSSSNVFPAIPTATTFTVGGSGSIQLNESGQTFVAYLFATCAGVSKVGSFTGNGSSQTINCGFTGGARFVMIKATSTTGDWMVADSARGIVSGSDPYLELNNTNAEVTGEDWLDTDSTGFVVNEVSGSNANTNGVTYIFLAIA